MNAYSTITDNIVHAALAAAPGLRDGVAGKELISVMRLKHAAQYRAIRKASKAVIAAELTEAQLEEEITAISRWCSSEYRLNYLLPILRSNRVSNMLFWRAFRSEWSVCDATWEDQQQLVRLLRRRRPSPPLTDLPEQLTVYRGCSRKRVRAISWTLDRLVAEGFARGHRGIAVPEPVVARARINRSDAFLFITDREESEILLDPDQLFDLTLEGP